MRTVGLVQARVGSTRLPGKVLADLAGRPMLDRVVARARAAKRLDDVWVVTSTEPQDDAIATWAASRNVALFRGSLNDVLDRYARAARKAEAEVVVRITADCPLLDPAVVDATVDLFSHGAYDYVSNCLEPTFPDGLDVEVFRAEALAAAHAEARLPSEREHVTPFIWKQPNRFRIGALRSGRNLGHLRWTVDEQEDLAFARRVFESLGDAMFGMDEVLALLQRNPELASMNGKFDRNEGYEKSIRAESTKGGIP